MCLICASFKNNELTILEAWSNYGEMVETMEPEHAEEVFLMLVKETQTAGPQIILPPPTIEKIKGKING